MTSSRLEEGSGYLSTTGVACFLPVELELHDSQVEQGSAGIQAGAVPAAGASLEWLTRGGLHLALESG